MSEIKITTEVNITATLTLTEGQLRALDALAGYGDDAFLRVFYANLGEHCMKPFEQDLRNLFDMIRDEVPCALAGVKESRESLGLKSSSGKWVKKANANN